MRDALEIARDILSINGDKPLTTAEKATRDLADHKLAKAQKTIEEARKAIKESKG